MLLVALTFPLIWVGGLVTTFDAGMAVPDWPTTFGYNMFLYPWTKWLWGPWDLFIEHGHRLLASTVGLVSIMATIATYRYDSRVWVRRLSLGCLVLVILQGVLGGLRVLLQENTLARAHGCTGPLFLAFAVALSAVTSQWWQESAPAISNSRFARTTWVMSGMAYLQLILGAYLRHPSYFWPASVFSIFVVAHILMALALWGHAAVLGWRVASDPALRSVQLVRRPTLILWGLVTTQLLLGAAVWRVKYNWPDWLPQPADWKTYAVQAEGMLQTMTVTAHVALGSLILAIAVLLSIRSSRLWNNSVSSPSVQKLTAARVTLGVSL